MSPAPLHGRSESFGASPDDLRESIMGKLGDTNMQKGGITFGTVAHGNAVGKMDAVYADIATVTGTDVYTVRHSLGHVPGFVRLWHSENTSTPASHYDVIAWNTAKWTENTIQVRVAALVGVLTGGNLTLMIGGN